MPVSAFFDESGKFRDKDVISFCGMASEAVDFRGFVRDWELSLHACGLTCLTMKEALNARRPLSKKTPALGDERIPALLPFIASIRKNVQMVSGVAVDVKAFKRLPPHYFQIFGSDPIYTAFLRTLLQIVDATPEGDKIHLVCDEDEETAWPMYKFYRQVKKIKQPAKQKLRAITFADDEHHFALQAADMIASLMRLEAGCRFLDTLYDYRPLFENLTAQPRDYEHIRFCEMAFAIATNLNPSLPIFRSASIRLPCCFQVALAPLTKAGGRPRLGHPRRAERSRAAMLRASRRANLKAAAATTTGAVAAHVPQKTRQDSLQRVAGAGVIPEYVGLAQIRR